MAITLTEYAANHVKQQLAKRGKGLALRVGIKKSGCSGFAYTFDYADEVRADEKFFDSLNVGIVVNVNNLPFLDGSQVDFVKDGLNSTFKFNNPNIDNACGCGESFSFKEQVKT
ncbi:MAG: iron-sulfur cluster assembly accessory protein [Nitrosomonas sp.]|nr:iron-sulfur cluster assembly accessory protein [Nitrosomonas sp.]MDP1950780.1 iron-sulfur cluster assembly accessory protein [Nitrosomonas sp.]